jgi:hypothetical protein
MDETERLETMLDLVAHKGWSYIEEEAAGEIEGLKNFALFNAKTWEDVLVSRGRALALSDLLSFAPNLSSEDVDEDA